MQPDGKGKTTPIGRIQPVKMTAEEVAGAKAARRETENGNVEQLSAKPTAELGARKSSAKSKQPIGGIEREFMPAALEILETPANPAGRLVSLTIVATFVGALVWACLGKIDIVAMAPGRVVPVGGSKLVQAQAISTVRAIHVAEGQRVSAGDVLVELDDTENEVDIDQLVRQRAEAQVEAARLEAFIRAVNGGSFSFAMAGKDWDPALVAMQRSRLASDLASYQAKMGSLRAELNRRNASIETTKAEVAKLTELRPLVAEREATMLQLMEQGHTPKAVWQQIKAQLIDVTHDLKIKAHLITEARNGMFSVERQIEGLGADTLQKAYSDLVKAKATFVRADLALRKAHRREAMKTLKSPVGGTVHRMTVHTIGGVVRPADPLMIIVPDNARLEVKAQVLNRDKGVVSEGRDVEIKFEAFDFTRYGTVEGKVLSVSNDALESEGLGLVFDTRVSMDKTSIDVGGEIVPITPGMTVTVEIKTGERRIIDFLLSPLKRYQDEAIRER